MNLSKQVYGWKQKLAEGEQGERVIARELGKFGKVYLVGDMEFQRVGIDAFFVSDTYGYTSMQFKRCSQAARYGNAFIEYEVTASDGARRRGWALKTTAQHVVYWAVGLRKLYLMDAMAIKRRLAVWQSGYPVGKGHSEHEGRTWSALGVCVPLSIIAKEVCTQVLEIEESATEVSGFNRAA